MYFKISSLLFFFTLAVTAQEKYASQNLKTIFDQLPLECRKQLIEKRECNCVLKGTAFQLRCEIEEKEIIQVGLKVFDDSIHKNFNKALRDFIEQEFLRFILDDNKVRELRRDEDQVYLFYGNSFQENILLNIPDHIQNVISDIDRISINQDSLKYNVLIKNTLGEKLEMEFPVINTLISGMDKKELDESIYFELSKEIKTKPNHKEFLEGSFNSKDDLLVGEGEHFLIKDFSSCRYYVRENGVIKLVYDKKYVTESLSNLFLAGESVNYPISIDLKIKGYGNNEKFILITVDKFLSHFDDQFKLYFGIEDTCNDHLRGTLILYNSSLNYLHLIDIKTDVGALFENPGTMTGTFFPYIPTHNIKDLFGKDDNKETILRDDLLNGNTYE
jgi:hypothetical protein